MEQDARVRLEAFKAYKVKHPRLEEMDRHLMRGSRTSGLRINISDSSRAVCVVSISRLSALEGVFSPLSPTVGLPLSAR